MFGHLYSKQQTTEPRGAPFAAGVITTRYRDKAKAKAGLRSDSDPAVIFSQRIWRSWSRLTAVRLSSIPSVRSPVTVAFQSPIYHGSFGRSPKPERSTGFGFAPQSRVRAPPSLLRSAPVSGVTVIRCWTSTHRSIGRSVDGAFASVITCGNGGVHVLGFTTLVSSVNHEALKARRETGTNLLSRGKNRRLFFRACIYPFIYDLFMRNGNNKSLNKEKKAKLPAVPPELVVKAER